MVWIWQQKDWPKFHWQVAELADFEKQFIASANLFWGSVKHLNEEAKNELVLEVLCSEADKTSAIEGELLDRSSVQISLQRNLGFPVPQNKKTGLKEQGIAALMFDLYQNIQQPMDKASLCRWQGMVMEGSEHVVDIARFRTHPEPMQIVSGPHYHPKVHYEAPPSASIEQEMALFFAWFADTAPGGKNPLAALTRAGIAHVYFEWIHPFEDGNGRVGRAIAERALAQELGRHSLVPLATAIEKDRKTYYQQLERAGLSLDITSWLVWFAETILKAQQAALQWIDFTLAKTKLFDRLRDKWNPRQEKALQRLAKAGPSGFEGGLSACNYMAITQTSAATARRDLAELVAWGALRRTGERRYTRYFLSI